MWLILMQTVLKRSERLQSMRHGFTQSEPGMWWNIMLVMIMISASLSLIWLLHRIQRRRSEPAKPQPMGLYIRVLGNLKLPLLDRWWLWRLAKALNIAHPTALLISEHLYDQAVRQYCQNKSSSRGASGAKSRFAAIRSSLFDNRTTETPA